MTSEYPEEGPSITDILVKARKSYDNISAALLKVEAGLKAGDTSDVPSLAQLLRHHWKSLQTVLELEIDLEKRRRERAGIVHGYALDLDSARIEVGRRLACLRDASRAERVSGEPE